MRKNQIILFYLLLLIFSLPLHSVKCTTIISPSPTNLINAVYGFAESLKQITVDGLKKIADAGAAIMDIDKYAEETLKTITVGAKEKIEHTIKSVQTWKSSTIKSLDEEIDEIEVNLEGLDIFTRLLDLIYLWLLKMQRNAIALVDVIIQPFLYAIRSIIDIAILIGENFDKVMLTCGIALCIIGWFGNPTLLIIGIPLTIIGAAPILGYCIKALAEAIAAAVEMMQPMTVLMCYALVGVSFSMIIFSLLRRKT